MMRASTGTDTTWAVQLPKAGHTADEYEDAWAAEPGPPRRLAVADGATESAFARTWAEILAHGFVDTAPLEAEALETAVADWRVAWEAAVERRVQSLPWYAAAKVEAGAYATLLGVEVDAAGGWRAIAVGDCCLFHLREGELLRAWPFDSPAAFSHTPSLLPSRTGAPLPEIVGCTGQWQPGDVLALATDALAAMLLRTQPARVLGLTPETFAEAVERGRADGTLRNDDVTLLVTTC